MAHKFFSVHDSGGRTTITVILIIIIILFGVRGVVFGFKSIVSSVVARHCRTVAF